jgi:hypothetical protein
MNIIDMTIKKYADLDKVGAAGQMRCDGNTTIACSIYDVNAQAEGAMISDRPLMGI